MPGPEGNDLDLDVLDIREGLDVQRLEGADAHHREQEDAPDDQHALAQDEADDAVQHA